jgi:hypothetical protein
MFNPSHWVIFQTTQKRLGSLGLRLPTKIIKVENKNHFWPKSLGTLRKSWFSIILGIFEIFILPDHFRHLQKVEKKNLLCPNSLGTLKNPDTWKLLHRWIFCFCPPFWVVLTWKREYVGKNNCRSCLEHENLNTKTLNPLKSMGQINLLIPP